MNKLEGKLPLIAFVVAAFAAVAFTSPETTDLYGEASGVWYDVTGITPDDDTYVCDLTDPEGCLFDQPFGMGNPISGPDQDKAFIVQNASRLNLAE